MTTLQTQFVPHFQTPVIEDPMELTSDIDQRAGGGDDIDIDLDLTGDNPQDGEDEFMGEEGMNALADSTFEDGLEAHAANDDEMADDIYARGHVDEGSSVHDEDIEDAEYAAEPDVDVSTVVEPALVLPNDQSEDLLAKNPGVFADQDAERSYHEPVHKDQEHHAPSITPEAESGAGKSDLPNIPTGLGSPNHDVTKVSGPSNSDEYDVGASNEGTVEHDAADTTSDSYNGHGLIALEANLELTGEEVIPASPDLSSAAQSNREGSHSQEESSLDHSIHLHTVMLYYQGEETFLFPPLDQNEDNAATFLLKDEQLAYSAIGDLLGACRRVLSQSLGEQDELMISIDELDIHMSESTAESASTTLSELVDLYVRLQQNDGLENPPPLYMDLTSRTRFSRRLDILRNASTDGKGLSQLKDPQETERDQQHMVNGETDLSSHNAVLSDNDTYTSEHVIGVGADEGTEDYYSHGSTLPAGHTLQETGSAPQATQLYSSTDLTPGGNHIPESLLGSDSRLREARVRNDFFGETAGSKESLETAHSLAAEPEFQKAGDSLVDDGDFIDYEEVDELEGGTSSASSTLKGDAIDATAVRDHAVPKGPAVAENHEDRISQTVQEDALVVEETSPEFAPEKGTSDVSGLVQEEQPNLVEDLFQDSDFKGHTLSGQSDYEEETPEHEEEASVSQEIKVLPDVIVSGNGASDQLEAFAQDDEAVASLRQDTLHEIPDQVEREAYSTADIDLNGGGVEDFSLSQPFQSRSSGSRTSPRDDGLVEVEDVATEDELEEVDESLGNHENDPVSQLSEKAATHPAFFVDGLAQEQEDNDEITYEDDEYDTAFSHQPTKAEHNVGTSPGSLKRARSFHEDDDTLEEALQGAKRVRSG